MKTQLRNDPKLQEHAVIHGVLLPYCRGFNLSLLANNAPIEDRQSIGDHAVALINLVGDHGILNEDVWPENCIATRETTDPDAKYKLSLIDFAMSRVRRQDESDSEWSKDKCQWDEEGRMGCVIDIQLKYVGGAYNYTPSLRWGFMGMGDTWRPIELLEAYQKHMEGKTFEYLRANAWVPGEEALEPNPQPDRTHENVQGLKRNSEEADPRR